MIRNYLCCIVLAAILLTGVACQRVQEESWTLDRAATMVDEGDSFQLNVRGPKPRGLVWTSADGRVAQVDGRGEVLAGAKGDAWIVATDPKTGIKDSCLVSVGSEAQNPILPPTWDLYLADGEPHVFDGRMYIFGSHDNYDGLGDDGRLEWCSDNYHVIWSDDLLHWTDAGEALNLRDIPGGQG